jgi:hypothetical protein
LWFVGCGVRYEIVKVIEEVIGLKVIIFLGDVGRVGLGFFGADHSTGDGSKCLGEIAEKAFSVEIEEHAAVVRCQAVLERVVATLLD